MLTATPVPVYRTKRHRILAVTATRESGALLCLAWTEMQNFKDGLPLSEKFIQPECITREEVAQLYGGN